MTELDKFLISVLKDKSIPSLATLNKEWVDSDEIKRYVFVFDYYKTHGELPGLRSFCSEYGFKHEDIENKPAYYLQKLKERYVYSEIVENVPAVLKKLKLDPFKGLQELQSVLANLDLENKSSKDLRYSENSTDRFDEYSERKLTGGVTYMSTGSEVLDNFMYGYRKNDLITYGGRAGSKKTWLLCYLAIIAEHSLPENYGDIMFVTNEISGEEIIERMDCIRFLLGYSDFLRGTLTEKEELKYRKGLVALKKQKSRIIILYNCSTLQELEFKISLYQPSKVFVDGSYLMEPKMPQGWEKVQFITRGLKQICKDKSVPISNTTQLKRGAGTREQKSTFDAQDDFAFANSYVQDSDLAMVMFATKEYIYQEQVGMQVAKGRRLDGSKTVIFEAPLTTMKFGFFIDEGFSPVSPTTEEL